MSSPLTQPTVGKLSERIREMAALERSRLLAILGREPSDEELREGVEDMLLALVEQMLPEEQQLASDAERRVHARAFLQETGVLSTLKLI